MFLDNPVFYDGYVDSCEIYTECKNIQLGGLD